MKRPKVHPLSWLPRRLSRPITPHCWRGGREESKEGITWTEAPRTSKGHPYRITRRPKVHPPRWRPPPPRLSSIRRQRSFQPPKTSPCRPRLLIRRLKRLALGLIYPSHLWIYQSHLPGSRVAVSLSPRWTSLRWDGAVTHSNVSTIDYALDHRIRLPGTSLLSETYDTC